VSNTTGSSNSLFGAYTDVSADNLTNATAIGARAYVSASNALVLGQINGVNNATANTNVGIGVTAPLYRLHVNGIIRVETLGAAGSTSLCRNSNEQISTCSSSLRYKTNLAPFSNGLNIVNRLSPISFNWKDGGMRDVGLGAEDVAAVEPLLVIRNDKGEVEGVKYDRITLVLLNAVKEQQLLINKQQQQLDALRKLVCQSNLQAEACK
jgi:trimeric autotransporter adhesin